MRSEPSPCGTEKSCVTQSLRGCPRRGRSAMSFLNTILTALRGLATNKLRASLTTLGIIIGVASVIIMLALGNGARAAVAAQFRFLGSDAIQISKRMALKNGDFVDSGQILSYLDGLNLPSQVAMVSRVDM